MKLRILSMMTVPFATARRDLDASSQQPSSECKKDELTTSEEILENIEWVGSVLPILVSF
jgi:hypothetical protein